MYIYIYIYIYIYTIYGYSGTCVPWTPRDNQKCPDDEDEFQHKLVYLRATLGPN